MTTDIERLRNALEDRNLRKVAQRTGLHHNTVRNAIKEGCAPQRATVLALLAYVGLTPTDNARASNTNNQ